MKKFCKGHGILLQLTAKNTYCLAPERFLVPMYYIFCIAENLLPTLSIPTFNIEFP